MQRKKWKAIEMDRVALVVFAVYVGRMGKGSSSSESIYVVEVRVHEDKAFKSHPKGILLSI